MQRREGLCQQWREYDLKMLSIKPYDKIIFN